MLSKLSHSLAVIKGKQAGPSGRSNHIVFSILAAWAIGFFFSELWWEEKGKLQTEGV
jgi:hypothetical protein